MNWIRLRYVLIIIAGVVLLSVRAADEIRKIHTLRRIDVNKTVSISENNLSKNFFVTKNVDPNNYWLSAGDISSVYSGQYYSRDTFITFMGGVEANAEIRNRLAHSIDWFGAHMDKDGYLPIWFAEYGNELGVYRFAPYNRDEKDKGIRQLDHQLEYIDAILLYYKKTNDEMWLKEHIDYADKAYNYLLTKADNYLLVGDYSPYAGADWADLVSRSGKSAFVNAYWYKVNNDMSEMKRALGQNEKAIALKSYAAEIKKEYNSKLWQKSEPENCRRGSFGHYIGWQNNQGVYDYFEVDSNSLAVAVGLADKAQSQSIMNFLKSNYDYFVDENGASRVLCGYYKEDVTSVEPGKYQNGGYWYVVSYYLAMAFAKNGDSNELVRMYERTSQALDKYQTEGLNEWFLESGQPAGGKNQSWSDAFPIFLSSLIKSTNSVYRIE